MQVLSLREAKNNIKTIFESVFEDKEEVIIHRKGRESVIVISLDEYNGLKETKYLLQSENNKRQLLSSLAELRAGRGFEKELLQ